MRKKPSGFTLVELLVVIGIIALLISILLPALSKARKQANNAKCLANLHQLSVAYAAYLANNRGKSFPYAYGSVTDPAYDTWQQSLRPYYASAAVPQGQYEDTNTSVRLCPEASTLLDPQFNNGQGAAWGDFLHPWDYTDTKALDSKGLPLRLFSSYGINGWVYSPPSNANDLSAMLGFASVTPATLAQYQLQEVYAFGGNSSTTPFIGDAIRLDGWPLPSDQGPVAGGYNLMTGAINQLSQNNMGRFTTMRHGKMTNMAFMDGHAAPVGLRSLWSLRWYNQWIPPKKLPTFPQGYN